MLLNLLPTSKPLLICIILVFLFFSVHLFEIINELKKIKNVDLKSKGFGVSNNSQENTLNQLIVQIMN